MNENSPTNTSTSASHHGLTAEAISRRAYELWEQEGRPENRDLHHWLRAEKELLAEQEKGAGQSASSNGAAANAPAAQTSPARSANTDTQPLQGTRAAAAASRDTKQPKRSTPNPFPAETAGGRFVQPKTKGGGK